jgi:1,4-alpha-glucan branching enzyme
MAQLTVTFTFHSGIRHKLFSNVRLSGSWDAAGQYSNQWTEVPMAPSPDWTGCDAFRARVLLDATQAGRVFQWGVTADITEAPNTWVVATEVPDENSNQRYRSFLLSADATQQDYWFVTGRKFGAQKYFQPPSPDPGIQFAVWAPHAKKVEVVFAPFSLAGGATPTGYIADDGTGVDPGSAAVPLVSKGGGIWQSEIVATPALADFGGYRDRLYMYRITNEQNIETYKVDIFSRNQVGRGGFNPSGAHYAGSCRDLDGIVSCSVVSDPDQVTKDFNDTGVEKQTLIPEQEFWASEYTGGRRPPRNLQDLIIYELHVGSLGFPSTSGGTFADALAFVDSLAELGINAVELLPVLEFDGDLQWGYGTSLFFCLQTSAGGANQLKHFVRACHQRGIAVILDVVYNHFATADNERSEWGYDSDPNVAPQNNVWYWYEGQPTYYPKIDGGYLNNGSSGYSPGFREENVRQMFTSSAAALLDDFHIDGLRVDLTDAIHQSNTLNANGASVGSANLYGIKFLRELARTVKTLNPAAFLIAEDHTGWDAMTQSPDQGGVGFDAVWYADFYHHLIGDGNYGGNYAKLLKNAGYGSAGALRMDYFAGALLATQYDKISYHENHDEAGNDKNTERTIVTAVNYAPLAGVTRNYAEGRSRFAFGLSALSAGTPMFLMGEEIGAQKYFLYDTFFQNKEDLIGDRTATGQFLFRFYQDLIGLVTSAAAARSRALDVIYTHNDNRVIAFVRSAPNQKLLVLASLNDAAFASGYVIGTDAWRLPAGGWQEIFNSDAAIYGGDNVGNGGATLQVNGGQINAVIPAHGFVVLERLAAS